MAIGLASRVRFLSLLPAFSDPVPFLPAVAALVVAGSTAGVAIPVRDVLPTIAPLVTATVTAQPATAALGARAPLLREEQLTDAYREIVVEGVPLLCGVEAPNQLVDREHVQIDQCLNGHGDLAIAAREHRQHLADGLTLQYDLAKESQLAHHARDADGEVVNGLAILKAVRSELLRQGARALLL